MCSGAEKEGGQFQWEGREDRVLCWIGRFRAREAADLRSSRSKRVVSSLPVRHAIGQLTLLEIAAFVDRQTQGPRVTRISLKQSRQRSEKELPIPYRSLRVLPIKLPPLRRLPLGTAGRVPGGQAQARAHAPVLQVVGEDVARILLERRVHITFIIVQEVREVGGARRVERLDRAVVRVPVIGSPVSERIPDTEIQL